MICRLLFAAILLLCSQLTVTTGLAAEDEKAPARPARRIDPERLKQLRERFGNAQADLSKLKRMSWKVGESTREALVYFPPAEKVTEEKKALVPLVFVFHGHGGRSEYSVRKLPIHEFWPEAICVYPQGLPTAVPVIDVEGKFPGWQKYVGDQNDRDLEFFDAMLKSIRAGHPVDPRRIYSTGHSNGACFTYVLWAARGDTFAAVAPIAGFINPRDFKAQKPLPMLHVAGEQDKIVKFAWQELSIEQVRKLNGCDAEGKPAGELCTEYTSKDGPPVVAYIHPGAHEIPDGAPKRIAEFFKLQEKREKKE